MMDKLIGKTFTPLQKMDGLLGQIQAGKVLKKSVDDFDCIRKVVLGGSSMAGKSNIVLRLTGKSFNENSKSTIGVEFGTKIIDVNRRKIKAQIWDTAGLEKYRAITSAYYRGAAVVVLVFDVSNPKSFEELERWISEGRTHCDPNTPIVLVGNKVDLDPQVAPEVVEEFAARHQVPYFQTSALTGAGVEEMLFESLLLCEEDVVQPK